MRFSIILRRGVVWLEAKGVLDSFCEAFEECGLHDLGFSAYEFTWENRRGDGRVVEERLDKFCATIEWSLIFLGAEVLRLDERYSDHLPILLKLSRRIASRRKELK